MEREVLHKKDLCMGKKIYKSPFSKVYKLNDYIIKILNDNNINASDLKKIEGLISNAKPIVAFPEIVIPSKILVNKNGKFIGYKEEFIKGYTLKEYLLKKLKIY